MLQSLPDGTLLLNADGTLADGEDCNCNCDCPPACSYDYVHATLPPFTETPEDWSGFGVMCGACEEIESGPYVLPQVSVNEALTECCWEIETGLSGAGEECTIVKLQVCLQDVGEDYQITAQLVSDDGAASGHQPAFQRTISKVDFCAANGQNIALDSTEDPPSTSPFCLAGAGQIILDFSESP